MLHSVNPEQRSFYQNQDRVSYFFQLNPHWQQWKLWGRDNWISLTPCIAQRQTSYQHNYLFQSEQTGYSEYFYLNTLRLSSDIIFSFLIWYLWNWHLQTNAEHVVNLQGHTMKFSLFHSLFKGVQENIGGLSYYFLRIWLG